MDEMVIYSKDKILQWANDGFELLDEDGNKDFINFHTCREQFDKNSGLPPSDEPYIGFSCFSNNPPTITLYTVPPTVFQFVVTQKTIPTASGKFLARNMDDKGVRQFYEFKNQILKAGFSLGDLD